MLEVRAVRSSVKIDNCESNKQRSKMNSERIKVCEERFLNLGVLLKNNFLWYWEYWLDMLRKRNLGFLHFCNQSSLRRREHRPQDSLQVTYV